MLARPLPLALLAAALLAACAGDAPATPEPTTPEAETRARATEGVYKGSADDGTPPPPPPAPVAPAVRPPPSADGDIVDRPDHVAFVEEFLRRQTVNDVASLASMYGDRVRFFDLGVVGREEVAADKASFFERWPNRFYGLASPVRATGGASPTLRFEYEYAVSGPGDASDTEGRAWTELVLAPAGGGYAIVEERGGPY